MAMHGPGTLKEQSDSTKWGMTREQTVEIVTRAQGMPNIELKETHFHLSRMSNDPENFAIMARDLGFESAALTGLVVKRRSARFRGSSASIWREARRSESNSRSPIGR